MAKRNEPASPAEIAALLHGHWYDGKDSKTGQKVRYCKHCDLPLYGTKSRGYLHSHCLAEPSLGRGHPSPVTVPLALHSRSVIDGGGVPEWSIGFDLLLEGASAQARFEDCLSAYSLKLHETFIVKLNGGEKQTEIAEHLGVSENAIYDRIYRMRRFAGLWSQHRRAIRQAQREREEQARKERAA